MHTLVIESDEVLGQRLNQVLGSYGAPVRTVASGVDGVEFARNFEYDLLVLGVTPDLNTLEMLRTLRNARCKTPVIVLGSTQPVAECVRALNYGADDYLTPPYHNEELLARARAVVRRSRGHAHSTITVGNLSILLNEQRARANGTLLDLTPREYQVLEILALRKGEVATYEHILYQLYANKESVTVGALRAFMCNLRKKIGRIDAESAARIENEHGVGYALRVPEPAQKLAA